MGLLKIASLLYHYFANLSFNNDVSFRCCRINGFRKNNVFGIKCYYQKYPLKFIAVNFTVLLLVFSIAVRVMEYKSSFADSSIDFTTYINSFWFVGATMTTIGYGDFYPNTSMGRVIAYSIYLCGLFLISITFGTVMDFL